MQYRTLALHIVAIAALAYAAAVVAREAVTIPGAIACGVAIWFMGWAFFGTKGGT